MAKSNIAIGVDPGNVWKHSILSEYRHQLEKQEQAEEKYKRAYERATMTTSYIRADKVQGGNKKYLFDWINDLQPLRDEASLAVQKTTKAWMKLNEYISSVESKKLKLLLTLIYSNGLDYKETSKKIRLARGEKIEVLHNQALRMVRCEYVK
ncbi:hypothetical protein [Acetobacterium wieringae]|uniref:hypothetical protein n=1 Tax=Acetobacterium wieringae TaxID=52694 RepID=UPI0031587DC8